MELENVDNCCEEFCCKKKKKLEKLANRGKAKHFLFTLMMGVMHFVFTHVCFPPFLLGLLLDTGHILPGLVKTDSYLANLLNSRLFLSSALQYILPGS